MWILLLLVTLSHFIKAAEKPNIVFFLTDDQDQLLGGSFPRINDVTPMPKTQKELEEKGVMATNFFIHTPICCPSRSETVTGRYLHNVKIFNNIPGRKPQCPEGYNGKDDQGHTCCMHVDEALVNNFTFARSLKEDAGYTVGMFGKYLNNCPNLPPPGFDAWLANGGGEYFSPQFAVQNIDGLPNGTWKGSKTDYTTAVVGNRSIDWIRKVAKKGKPFFAYIAPKAAHEPFTPATWYKNYWDKSWPATSPRPPSFNCSAEIRADHHPTIAAMDMFTNDTVNCIDNVYKNRWRTLMSVDDVIQAVIDVTDELGVLHNTYFFYSSDHGFQLGELNLPFDKRNVYEFDVRIHLLARGPGIKAGSKLPMLASNVDLGPTFLDLAGLKPRADMDGKSLLPLMISDRSQLPDSVKLSLSRVDNVANYAANWRESLFIEYYYVGIDNKCGMNHPIEEPDNNFIAVRHMNKKYGNILYAEFQNGTTGWVDFKNPNFYEMYDIDKDPWQLHNIYSMVDNETKAALHKEVHQWLQCKGQNCP